MKRALKGLFRKGEANVVKIICLSVGLAIGLVMLAEVIFGRSYDNFLPGLKETYRVEERYKQKDTDWREHAQTPGAIGPGLQRYCPAVEVATRFTGIGSMTLTTEDRQERNLIRGWKRPTMPISLPNCWRWQANRLSGKHCHGNNIPSFM